MVLVLTQYRDLLPPSGSGGGRGNPFVLPRGGTVLLGMLCFVAFLAEAALLPSGAAALAGFVAVGLGAANVVPVLFSAAGRLPGLPPGVALSAVSTLGYAGILAGPALVGFVAQASTLPVVLGCIGGMMFSVAASARGAAGGSLGSREECRKNALGRPEARIRAGWGVAIAEMNRHPI